MKKEIIDVTLVSGVVEHIIKYDEFTIVVALDAKANEEWWDVTIFSNEYPKLFYQWKDGWMVLP